MVGRADCCCQEGFSEDMIKGHSEGYRGISYLKRGRKTVCGKSLCRVESWGHKRESEKPSLAELRLEEMVENKSNAG